MIRKIFVVILLLCLTNMYGALVQNEIAPGETLKNKEYSSIVIFPFDGKGLSEKYDFLSVSSKLQKDLLSAFEQRTRLHAVLNTKISSVNESIQLEVRKGSLKVKDYTQRSDSKTKNIQSHPSKQIPLYLVGTIDAFYPSPEYKNSFIQITIQVVDSKSKVVYWATSIAGCYQFVINSIADSIEQKRFIGPTVKDEKNYNWVNPKRDRLLVQAVGYNLGGLFPLGNLKKNFSSSWLGEMNVYFTLPYLLPVRNKISFAVSEKLQDKGNTNIRHLLAPLYISFIYDIPAIYNFDWVPAELSVSPYLNVGILYQTISFPGYTYQIDSLHNLTYLISPGFSLEYYLSPITYRYKNIIFYIPKIGFIANCNFNFFEYENFSAHYRISSFFNFNLGLKFYL